MSIMFNGVDNVFLSHQTRICHLQKFIYPQGFLATMGSFYDYKHKDIKMVFFFI